MADMFARDQICEPARRSTCTTSLSAAFREDLYVTDLTRPLNQPVPKVELGRGCTKSDQLPLKGW